MSVVSVVPSEVSMTPSSPICCPHCARDTVPDCYQMVPPMAFCNKCGAIFAVREAPPGDPRQKELFT